MGLRIALDTGGTFTDVVAIEEADGRRFALKTPSTPADPSIGLLDGIRKAAEAADRDEGAVARLLHGSTTATNAVLEHRFEWLGLIVTKGFRHIIEIARQSVPDGYGHSFFWVKPPRRTSWPRKGSPPPAAAGAMRSAASPRSSAAMWSAAWSRSPRRARSTASSSPARVPPGGSTTRRHSSSGRR